MTPIAIPPASPLPSPDSRRPADLGADDARAGEFAGWLAAVPSPFAPAPVPALPLACIISADVAGEGTVCGAPEASATAAGDRTARPLTPDVSGVVAPAAQVSQAAPGALAPRVATPLGYAVPSAPPDQLAPHASPAPGARAAAPLPPRGAPRASQPEDEPDALPLTEGVSAAPRESRPPASPVPAAPLLSPSACAGLDAAGQAAVPRGRELAAAPPPPAPREERRSPPSSPASRLASPRFALAGPAGADSELAAAQVAAEAVDPKTEPRRWADSRPVLAARVAEIAARMEGGEPLAADAAPAGAKPATDASVRTQAAPPARRDVAAPPSAEVSETRAASPAPRGDAPPPLTAGYAPPSPVRGESVARAEASPAPQAPPATPESANAPYGTAAARIVVPYVDERGESGTLRVMLRGTRLEARIEAPDAATARRMERGIDQLQAQLKAQGFTEARVTVQSSRAGEAPRSGAEDRNEQSHPDARRQSAPEDDASLPQRRRRPFTKPEER